MSQKLKRLPVRLPANVKYILEIGGRSKGMILIRRYVELPDGRRLTLAPRWTATCGPEVVSRRHSSRPKRTPLSHPHL